MAKRKAAAAPVTTRIATFIGSKAGKLANRADALTTQAAQVKQTVSKAGKQAGDTLAAVAATAVQAKRSVTKTAQSLARAAKKR